MLQVYTASIGQNHITQLLLMYKVIVFILVPTFLLIGFAVLVGRATWGAQIMPAVPLGVTDVPQPPPVKKAKLVM